MLHASIFALLARSRSPLGAQLTPQGLNFADSHCELVVVPHMALRTSTFDFLWGSIFYPANDFTQIWPDPRFFDLISSSSLDHGHPELNHAPCGIIALYPSLAHR